MSIDLGQTGRGVFYLNFRQVQDETGLRTCTQTQEFNFGNLIEKSADYMIAIERLIVPIHRVPMNNGFAPAITVTPIGPGLIATITIGATFSLKQFIDVLNSEAAVGGIGIIFSLNPEGRLQFSYDDFANNILTLNQGLADIIDIQANLTAADADANNIVIGATSVFDRFDQLYKIQIESLGMNITQEIIDTDRTLPILTDFIVPTQYSISYTQNLAIPPVANLNIGISYSTRQSVVYNAEGERRYIMLKGNTPIQNIQIQAVAIFKNNSRNEIVIPPNAVFECKLGFYRR